jgi:hypothetical protein
VGYTKKRLILMNFYTFKNDVLSFNSGESLYNLSDISVLNIDFTNTELGIYIVPREHEMRLDLISFKLYGTTNYVEELMKINNILNPFSIKEGDIINYVSTDKIPSMHSVKEDRKLKALNLALVDPNKNTEKEKLPPSVKPKGKEQLVLDKKNKKIRIINNFQR